MNRRNVLSLSAIAAFGLTLLSGNAVAQQAVDMEGVKAASKAFYAALAALDGGVTMGKVWANTSYITYVGPSDKTITVGWDAQKKMWEETDKLFSERKVALGDAHTHVNGNLAWEMGLETGDAKMKDGTPRKINWFATNVYEKIDGRWLMVSHHVQPKPQ
jgi:ketosteroid isomerase-like protein